VHHAGDERVDLLGREDRARALVGRGRRVRARRRSATGAARQDERRDDQDRRQAGDRPPPRSAFTSYASVPFTFTLLATSCCMSTLCMVNSSSPTDTVSFSSTYCLSTVPP